MSQTAKRVECAECDREFTVEFTGTAPEYQTTTRFCPRCGAKL